MFTISKTVVALSALVFLGAANAAADTIFCNRISGYAGSVTFRTQRLQNGDFRVTVTPNGSAPADVTARREGAALVGPGLRIVGFFNRSLKQRNVVRRVIYRAGTSADFAVSSPGDVQTMCLRGVGVSPIMMPELVDED